MFPILFSIGSIRIFSFSVFVVLAWCTWSFLFWRHLRDEGVDEDRIFTLMFWTTVTAFIFARFGFVVTHWSAFTQNVLKIAALWVAPGLSLYSGLVAAILFLLWRAKKSGVRVGYAFDALGISLPLSLLVGQIGSLLDGSVVGRPTSAGWGIQYLGHLGSRHPVQLYDMLALCIMGFVMLRFVRLSRRARWPYGMVGVRFFLFYASFAFIIEFFKQSEIYLYTLSANQWILLALFAEAFGAFYIRGGGREKIQPVLRFIYDRISKRFTRRHTQTS